MWWDPVATRDDVLALLRITEQDPDVGLVDACIPAAAAAIEHDVDRTPDDPLPGPPPPPALQQCLVAASMALYYRGGAVATIGGTVVPVGASRDEPFDPLVDVREELTPFKQGWAVA